MLGHKLDLTPEVLNASFISVFNSKTSFPRGIQPPELEDKDWEQNEASAIQAEMVYTTKTHTSPALVLQQLQCYRLGKEWLESCLERDKHIQHFERKCAKH